MNPSPSQNTNSIQVTGFKKTISAMHETIPATGRTGTSGTLNVRGMSGSVPHPDDHVADQREDE